MKKFYNLGASLRGFQQNKHSHQSPRLQRLAKNIFLLVASLDLILEKSEITRALIRQRW